MRVGALRSLRKLTVGAAALLLLAGCATGGTEHVTQETAVLPPLSEVTPLVDPVSHTGPTVVKLPESRIEAFLQNPQPQLPVTVTSHTLGGDQQVEVRDVSRIVPLSLGGSVGDYVYTFGFGDKIVGRDVSTVVPELEDVPVVTRNGHSVDAESVLALNPTLVITDGTIGPTDVVDQFADAGVTVVYVENAADYESSYVQAQQIADLLGVGDKAPELIAKLRHDIEAKEQEIAAWLQPVTTRPRVAFLYMRGEGVFYLFGEGSGIDTLFKSLGVTDVAAEINWVGQRPMNDEALIEANPDTLLVMEKGLESVGGVEGMLTVHPATALTEAGKKQRVVSVADTGLFVGAPRVPAVLDGLARAFYAPDSLE